MAELAELKAVTPQQMQKRKISTGAATDTTEPDWLALEDLADVEVSSESASHPIEAALLPGFDSGWRADAPGRQIIRLKFKSPLALRHVRLVVDESEQTRTQEFVLRVMAAPDGRWRDVARQQFNFSPSGATREQEDYHVDLPSVSALEITIVPDISGGDARASLRELRLS